MNTQKFLVQGAFGGRQILAYGLIGRCCVGIAGDGGEVFQQERRLAQQFGAGNSRAEKVFHKSVHPLQLGFTADFEIRHKGLAHFP
ncbi:MULTISPECIES: hypothetical protein [unclassified Desulfovibrio]|uniref:hypothetical protein n=1 Tax=unclassified Desulfovibrio TaxID=2593640 RepID=UPI00163A2382|nr:MULTISPECIES: hypothetical protein [unclassified Desulfovibrio]